MNPSLLNGYFVAGLLVLVALRNVAPRRIQTTVVLGGGPLLIALASFETFLVIGGSSVLVLFPLALGMRSVRRRGGERSATRWLLIGGVVSLLTIWLLYRICRDYDLPVLGATYSARLAAAFGFSYFLFRAISYLYMHHLVDLPERTPLPVLGYSLFPTTVTSGPIHLYGDFKRQSEHLAPLSLRMLGTAVFRVTQGFFYKICLAAWLQAIVDRLLVVESPGVLVSLVEIALLYLIFFFDFAGYSHIAIGFGLLLGVKVPENFKRPFLATSITEFWRNWHATLAEWFRNHVFIPAGGMRSGRVKAGMLAAGIMLACGVWHGFTVPFLLWGLWHGGLLLFEALGGTAPMPRRMRQGWAYWRRVFLTNAKVALGALLFLPSFDAIGRVLGGFVRWL